MDIMLLIILPNMKAIEQELICTRTELKYCSISFNSAVTHHAALKIAEM